MPRYDYRCTNGHQFEEMQSFSSAPVATCGECGSTASRLPSVPMVLYKGSGFYTTDYGRNGSVSKSESRSRKREYSSSDSSKKKSSAKKESSPKSTD